MKIIGTGVHTALDTILFATDFSPASKRAEMFLAGLAKHASSRVLILHVLDPYANLRVPDAQIGYGAARQKAEVRLAAEAAQLESEQIKIEAVLAADAQPTEAILALAREKCADLIVIATRGLGALGRLALGSVAQQLIREAECPVLTVDPQVKTPQPGHKFQRLVCATDFSEHATAAVEFALSFAQSYSAHMYLCHVLPKPGSSDPVDTQELNERFKAELQRQVPVMARERCDPECVLDHGYAVDGILLLANRVKADLVVLGTRRASSWFASISAGIAFEVIRKADCPVLTVRK
jgi:nucleotide-binding universal stress UspA family protein